MHVVCVCTYIFVYVCVLVCVCVCMLVCIWAYVCVLTIYFTCTAPATKVDPVNTQAALEAFDEYYDLARDHIEVEPFTMNCVGFGVIAEISPFTGASIFLPQYLRMDNVLRLIRSNIALNGKSTLLLMIRIIDKMGNCQLAGFFESMFIGICVYML